MVRISNISSCNIFPFEKFEPQLERRYSRLILNLLTQPFQAKCMQLGLAKDNQVDKSIQSWRKLKKNKNKDRNNPYLYISG